MGQSGDRSVQSKGQSGDRIVQSGDSQRTVVFSQGTVVFSPGDRSVQSGDSQGDRSVQSRDLVFSQGTVRGP